MKLTTQLCVILEVRNLKHQQQSANMHVLPPKLFNCFRLKSQKFNF
jgi:hypothetical protein